MMRVNRSPTPRGFVANVFRPGRAWLKGHPYPAQVPPLWNTKLLENGVTVREELAERYHHICAYTLFRLTAGFTVDHFRPKQHCLYRNLSYSWLNYRLSDARLNNWKGSAFGLIDPFKIGMGACVLNFEKDAVVEASRNIVGWETVEKTIGILHLNDGAYKTARYDAYTRYLAQEEKDHIGVIPLTQDCPFVAYEMLRQRHIKDRDRESCISCLHELGFLWVR